MNNNFGFLKKSDSNLTRKITVTFDAIPTTIQIDKAYYKYDKEFALSYGLDDGLVDAYRTALPLFTGGTVIYEDGVTPNYPGLYYTDGAGNNIPFSSCLNINMSSINPTIAGANISEVMLREAYVKGFAITNHSYSAQVVFDLDPVIRDQEINAQIDDNFDALKNVTGIKITNFTAPSNDPQYDPITAARMAAGELKFVNNVNNPGDVAHNQTAEYWIANLGLPIGVRRDFVTWQETTVNRDNTDFDFIDTKLLAVGSDHAWFTMATHNVDIGEAGTPGGGALKYLSFLHLMEGIESRYGASGSDNMWMAPINNVWEYLVCARDSIINTVQNGNILEITIDFSAVDPEYTDHALSMILDADANITNITYEGWDENTHAINYQGQGNDVALINVGYKPQYEKAVFNRLEALVYVEIFETTKTQTDKDIAQAAVDNLNPGAYKDSLQARIDAVVVIPDALIYQIDFGRDLASGYQPPFPWNNFNAPTVGVGVGSRLDNLSSTISTISTLDIEITTAFAQFHANTSANAEFYPFEAQRDGFETPNGVSSSLQLQQCDPAKVYDFTFFASRGFVGSVTEFTIGATTVSVNHKDGAQPGRNTGNVDTLVSITDVVPDGSNNIDITITGNNGGSNDYGILNVLEITEKNP